MTVAKYLNVNGQNIYVNMIGEGKPIIFLHGGPGSEHRFFLPHVLPLSKKNKLVLYDQRGCGKSEPTLDNNYSIEEEVKTLETLRTQLQLEKMDIFGESWGSMLALCYATTYPERVNNLFLTAAIGIDQKGFKTFEKQLLKKISIKDQIKLLRTDREVKKGTASVEDVLDIVDPYYVYSKETLQEKEKTRMNHTVNHIMIEDIEKNYDLISKVEKLAEIPILIAQGSHDILPPSMIEELFIKYIPHAELREIKNCGHWTVVEQTDEINSMVDQFFSTVDSNE